jgi:acyl carrier protein
MNEQLSPALISEQLCAFARQNLLAGQESFNEHSRLSAVGLDSFSLVELLLFSERNFGVTVPESHLTHEHLESIASLARCIYDLSGAKAS